MSAGQRSAPETTSVRTSRALERIAKVLDGKEAPARTFDHDGPDARTAWALERIADELERRAAEGGER